MLEGTKSVCPVVLALHLAALGVDYELVLLQELVGHLYGWVHVSATVAAKVYDKRLHAVEMQVSQGCEHLGKGDLAKVLYAYVAYFVVNEEAGIYALHGYVSTYDGKGERFLVLAADNLQFCLRTLFALEVLHYLVGFHLAKVHAVGADYAVACQQSHFLGRTTMYHAHHGDRIVLHAETDAYTREGTFKVFVGCLHIFHRDVDGVWVQFGNNLGHGQFHKRVHIHGIHVVVVNQLEQVVYLAAACVCDAEVAFAKACGGEGAQGNA